MLRCCSSSFLWRSRVSVVHPNQKSERWIDRKTWKPAAPQSDAFRIKHQQHHLSIQEVHEGNATARDQTHQQLLLPNVLWLELFPVTSIYIYIIMNTLNISSTNYQRFLIPRPLFIHLGVKFVSCHLRQSTYKPTISRSISSSESTKESLDFVRSMRAQNLPGSRDCGWGHELWCKAMQNLESEDLKFL